MTILTLQPAAAAGIDTWLLQPQVNYNYGVSVNIETGRLDANQKRRGLLAFDLSSIPAGATLVSATLTLVCLGETVSTDLDVSVHRALVQWYEGAKNGAAPDASTDGSTWNYRNYNGSVAWGAAGGLSGTDYDATPTDTTLITGTSAHDWDVLADVEDWYGETADNYGWFIIGDEGTQDSRKFFASSDNATAGNRPKLVIEYTLPGKPVHFMHYQRMRK